MITARQLRRFVRARLPVWMWAGTLLCAAPALAGVVSSSASHVVADAHDAAAHSGSRASNGRRVRRAAPVATPWQHALAARERLEALEGPRPADFTAVLNEFRAIYHDNPQDAHAAEAVNDVAELLAAQGRALHNASSLKAAAAQYEFLRTQYPASAFARTAAAKQRTLKAELVSAREAPGTASSASPAARPARLIAPAAIAPGSVPAAATNRDEVSASQPMEKRTPEPAAIVPAKTEARRNGPLAQITGIRHWSTATYTRVAIDVGDQVTFEAARVAHPDRIYFDLHGAKLSPELTGRTFDVTDDGFLKKIRAAQFSGDMTRVVLDVSDVSDYSAFLLPNPYRLIIDIHGGRPAAAEQKSPAVVETAENSVPVPPSADRNASAAANSSGLPPTAPTDGGEFVRPAALSTAPAKDRAAKEAQRLIEPAVPSVARDASRDTARAPRVATAPVPKPVPNTVAVKSPQATVEVAAVSTEPREEATGGPGSKPIAVRSRDNAGTLARRDAAAKHGRNAATEAAAPAKAAARTADGETSMIRALGLGIGRIVIDAGHGGHDSGTLGVDGIQEKDVVLDVALRLGKLLHERLGAEIIYTRSDDTFIPLETRTAIANKAQADLFLSIHANSSQDESARGVETYYLNFTSSPDALDVAARENAVSGQSIHQLSDLVKKIALKDKIAESREFAADVESSLYAGLERGNAGLKDRGVKKAPFVVLIGANMPSILAEISFVTNGRDATQLRQPEYRQRVAESLYSGVARYEASLAGAKSPAGLRAAAQ